jgi:hypothetical protein
MVHVYIQIHVIAPWDTSAKNVKLLIALERIHQIPMFALGMEHVWLTMNVNVEKVIVGKNVSYLIALERVQ